MTMTVLFQCLLCVELYEFDIKYAGRFLEIKENSVTYLTAMVLARQAQ